MFTTEQIITAHSKEKSGADFPLYIREIKHLGVTSYEVFVTDGRTRYFGENDYNISDRAKYEAMTIAQTTNATQFIANLKAHQQGKTDYMTFCADCAKSGIEKWVVGLEKMTCTYFDLAGNEILAEEIPH